jgi:hypothetical protein
MMWLRLFKSLLGLTIWLAMLGLLVYTILM